MIDRGWLCELFSFLWPLDLCDGPWEGRFTFGWSIVCSRHQHNHAFAWCTGRRDQGGRGQTHSYMEKINKSWAWRVKYKMFPIHDVLICPLHKCHALQMFYRSTQWFQFHCHNLNLSEMLMYSSFICDGGNSFPSEVRSTTLSQHASFSYYIKTLVSLFSCLIWITIPPPSHIIISPDTFRIILNVFLINVTCVTKVKCKVLMMMLPRHTSFSYYIKTSNIQIRLFHFSIQLNHFVIC